MIISGLNSLRFVKQDSNFRNFTNTLTADEKFYNDFIFTYCQRFLTTDTVTVQIKSDSATVPTVTVTKSDKSTDTLTDSLVSSYDQDNDGTDDLFFFEFDVPMVDYQTEAFITVVQDGETWKSEPFHSDTGLYTEVVNGDVMVVEYYNQDNAFQVDFSTGLTYKIYVESTIKDLEFGGESSIYDNQDELTKLKETATRILNFKTLEIPRYLAEILRLASSCDNFVVNSVSYTRAELPEINPVDGSNLVEYSMKLTDKEYLGVNSHDTGFDCDSSVTSEIMVLTELNASGSTTFTVPAGYLVHTIRAEWVSGTTVEVKLGSTLSGSELAYPFNVTSSLTMITSAIHGDMSRSADVSIYATVTGGVANIDIQLIKNTQ